MTKKEKLLRKFLRNPTSLKFKQIQSLLIDLGFHQVKAKGSHVLYKYPSIFESISIPIHNNDCADLYKTMICKFILKYITISNE